MAKRQLEKSVRYSERMYCNQRRRITVSYGKIMTRLF